MTILHLSYTNGLHRQLAELSDADIIVHSGDFTMAGTEQETFGLVNFKYHFVDTHNWLYPHLL